MHALRAKITVLSASIMHTLLMRAGAQCYGLQACPDAADHEQREQQHQPRQRGQPRLRPNPKGLQGAPGRGGS